MAQLNYIVKRFLQMIPTLLIVTVLIFLIIHFIPGDPARLILGDKATEPQVALLTEKLGLNKPLIEQYFIYLKSIVTLDFGSSLKYRTPVANLLPSRLQVTASLTLVSALFSVLLTFPLGYWAAKKKDQWPDILVRFFTLLSLSMPSFWIGLLLMIVFGVMLKWFPVGGWGSNWPEHIRALILPGFMTSLGTSALLIRNLRNSAVDIQNMDYVDFARSKGIPESEVSRRHIIRNALISTVTLLAMRIAYMLGGSVITETIFSLPGLGKLLVESIFARDYAVIQSVVFLIALMVLVISLLTDILYSFLDPRVKFD